MDDVEKIQRIRWLSSHLDELGLTRAVCSRFYMNYSLDDQISMLESLIGRRLDGRDGGGIQGAGETADQPAGLEE